jgi:hypothetical protein
MPRREIRREIRQKLIAAGCREEVIDERLAKL